MYFRKNRKQLLKRTKGVKQRYLHVKYVRKPTS